MDRLTLMFEQQENFMNLLKEKRNFPDFPVDIYAKEGQKFCKLIAYEAMGELFEAIQHLQNSKSHRETEVTNLEKEKYCEELSDCLHYLFEVMILSGISEDEIFHAFMRKGKVNEERILSGY